MRPRLNLSDREYENIVARRKAVREAEAKEIDPKTAVVIKQTCNIADPYHDYDNFGVDVDECFGRLLFVARPNDEMWILVNDLPEAKRQALIAELETRPFVDSPCWLED